MSSRRAGSGAAAPGSGTFGDMATTNAERPTMTTRRSKTTTKRPTKTTNRATKTTKRPTKTKKRPTATTKRPSTTKREGPVAARTRAGAPAAPPMFEKIAFTMFQVQDAHRARAFYEGVLGFTRGLASPAGTWTEYDLPGGGCLALFKHPHAPSTKPPGGGTVAVEVADLDALVARLRAAGVELQGDMVHGPRCRMSNIVDTEGNAIVLHELAGKRAGSSPGARAR